MGFVVVEYVKDIKLYYAGEKEETISLLGYNLVTSKKACFSISREDAVVFGKRWKAEEIKHRYRCHNIEKWYD